MSDLTLIQSARSKPHPQTLREVLRSSLLLSCLVLLPAVLGTEALAGWEYGGSTAEVFDLEAYQMSADPEGFSSCSDGFGGLIVAAYDAATSPGRIRVSRVGHDGTELWGNGGVLVPTDIGGAGHHSPVAVAPDGVGGAYVAFLGRWPAYELFRLAHFTAVGAFERAFSVDNPGTVGEYDRLSIKLNPIANGDVIAIWTQRSPAAKLHAARFNSAGALQWHIDVNQSYSHRETVVTNTRTSWSVASDMLDGVLVTWLRLEVGTPQIGAQRIGPDGAAWWGNDGHLLWSGYLLDFHDPVIVGDVLGGGFVVMSHQGLATVQHLDPWGTEMWPSGGILVQNSGTPYWALSTNPAVCEDGAFGFIVVHGNEDLFAQRVDYWGNLLWGSGVAVGHRAGQQNKPDIAPDGAQGAVLAWQDLYYGMPEEEWHVLAGMRLNASGQAVWGPDDLYMAWTVYDPHDVDVVADGAGGALCAFACFDLSEYADDVWALGVGPGGTVGVDPVARIPIQAGLTAYPNPFAASTRIVVDDPAVGAASLEIFDVDGRLVRALTGAALGQGRCGADWDGRDDAGRTVANGIYLVRLSGPSLAAVTRVMRLR